MKKKKNLIWIGILSIAALVLISGCITEDKVLPSYPKHISGNDTLTPLQICEKISNKESRYECFSEINEIDKIPDNDLKNYYLAIKDNDTGLCKNIKQELKLSCYDKLVDENDLINYINVSICEESQWYGCYLRFARISGNISLCDKITQWPKLEGEKEECYINTVEKTGDASVCELVSNENNRKDRCFGRVCVKTGNIDYCEKIRSQEFKDMYYGFLAEEQNDTSYCEKIEDSYDRGRCILYLKYPDREYIEHCAEIENSELKSGCYSQLAINKSDALLCDKVIDRYERDYCYSSVAKSMGNVSLCEKIRDNERKNFCYFVIAVETSSPQVCEKISQYQCKAGCLGLTKNPKYCSEITSPIKMKWRCITDSASANMDITICKNLPYSPDGCYRGVAKSIYNYENDITKMQDYYDYGAYLCSKSIFNVFND